MSNKVSSKSRTVTVKLQYPFPWKTADGEREISEVTLGRPKGKHLKGLGKDVNFSSIIMIAAKIAKEEFITPAFFEEMDAADCMRVSEVVGDFLDSGHGIGETA